MADVPLMSNPMTTPGDIVTGGASGAAGRLAIGTAGQVLTVNSGATAPEWAAAAGGSGITSGTSFPGSPSDRDLFYRTDRDLLYFYDLANTRWLTVTLYHGLMSIAQSLMPAATSGQTMLRAHIPNDYDVLLIEWEGSVYVNTTNNGSNYWTLALSHRNAGSSTGTVGEH